LESAAFHSLGMRSKDQVGSYEARTHLARLLRRVERGERITVTRRGVPIAMLVPVHKRPAIGRKAAVEAIKAFAKRHTRGEVSIRELIEEGRKY
jgi:prevent-host-death family protein